MRTLMLVALPLFVLFVLLGCPRSRTDTGTTTPTARPEAPASVDEGQPSEAAQMEPSVEYILNPRDDTMRLILIPAGEAVFGADDTFLYAKPQFTASLPAYCLGETEVTNAQYSRFVAATGYQPPGAWPGGEIPGGKENHPVAPVSWDDAQAYCEWAGLWLPTELEWEKGARGTDGRDYPWGNVWDVSKCQNHMGLTPADGLCAVDAYPEGRSPWGLYNMSGNAWEWCSDWYDTDAYKRYASGDLTPPLIGGAQARMARGGSWFNNAPRDFHCASRGSPSPQPPYAYGFRCSRGL